MIGSDIHRKNPFFGASTVSGWLTRSGEFLWAQSHSSHEELAKHFGKTMDDMYKSGAIRIWSDGRERILTVGVDRMSELSSIMKRKIEDVAVEFSSAIRDDRGNIVDDYRT